MYPQVDQKVSAEEAEHAREEHARAEETPHTLEKLDADDPSFDDELATSMTESRDARRAGRREADRIGCPN